MAEFSLGELGGTPLPPLTQNHVAQKPLAEIGGTPPPLAEVVFDSLPYASRRLYEMRQPPTYLCTTSNFLVYNLKLPCVQPQTFSYNSQLPYGTGKN